MTLREFGAGIKGWFSTSFEALTTKNPVDWPISLLLIVVAVVFVASLIFVDWFSFWRAQVRREKEWLAQIPKDPEEKLEWANRTGRYAPKPGRR